MVLHFKYPKAKVIFIIDEATPAGLLAKLENQRNYTKIKFGIGVIKSNLNLEQQVKVTYWQTHKRLV
jgi:hypothetical protein